MLLTINTLTPFAKILIVIFAVMTVVGILVMGIDKSRAKKGDWRIKESTLFLVALLFGGVGTTFGMIIFRHKTKHWYFVVFMPLLAVLNVVAIMFLSSLNYGITPLV